jgi:hypothetical protein
MTPELGGNSRYKEGTHVSKQLTLKFTEIQREYTATEVFNMLADGNKTFRRAAFFKWLKQRDTASYLKGHAQGYDKGASNGYTSGRKDGQSIVRSNY